MLGVLFQILIFYLLLKLFPLPPPESPCFVGFLMYATSQLLHCLSLCKLHSEAVSFLQNKKLV
jgi:hypothetical protein